MNIDNKTIFSSVSPVLSFLLPTEKEKIFLRSIPEVLTDTHTDDTEFRFSTELIEKMLCTVYHSIDPAGFYADFPHLKDHDFPSVDPRRLEITEKLTSEREALYVRFPRYTATERPFRSSFDTDLLPSFETLIRSLLTCCNDKILELIDDAYRLNGKLLESVFERLAVKDGFASLTDAERSLDADAYDNEFTDGLCSGEG